ncbi:hypothetical protein [Lysinibacillus pakistanensis]|uniref:Potassium transporter n=1 Tax=Lysinibacillus pakistanensis TaxID=759811 RepID=A0ABX6D7Q8_9BACI|nr:hypothetical protein GDS87_06050 [Lysinibacillus pakistanensis]
MTRLLNSKKSGILLLVLLIASLLFALYYYVILPKKDEVQAKEASIQSLQTEIKNLEQSLTSFDEQLEVPMQETLEMQKKVPNVRAVEQVLRDMVEIEEVTGTRMESLIFNNYDEPVADANVGQTNTVAEAEAKVNEENQESSETPPISTISQENIPPELKLVTFTFDIGALTFDSMVTFLKEVEKLERVMKIDTIKMSLPGEKEKLDKEADTIIKATVQITTFYYEGQE